MNLGTLVSETRNPQTMDLDALPTPELVKRFNEQDTLVAEAVKPLCLTLRVRLMPRRRR